MKYFKFANLGLILVLLISVVFVSGCTLATEEGGDSSIWTMVIFIAVFFALMYFVLIRPQRKKQQEHQRLIEELQRGDKVITAGGIYGSIDSISEDSIVIKVDSGTTMRVAKGSVTLRQEKE
ncbi:MAG: preprotein translocase subunit YajC [Dehalococcoidales bacterium]|nr:preprotein translocase subunit YajC [Dehalococcoidales bacterium]